MTKARYCRAFRLFFKRDQISALIQIMTFPAFLIFPAFYRICTEAIIMMKRPKSIMIPSAFIVFLTGCVSVCVESGFIMLYRPQIIKDFLFCLRDIMTFQKDFCIQTVNRTCKCAA